MSAFLQVFDHVHSFAMKRGAGVGMRLNGFAALQAIDRHIYDSVVALTCINKTHVKHSLDGKCVLVANTACATNDVAQTVYTLNKCVDASGLCMFIKHAWSVALSDDALCQAIVATTFTSIGVNNILEIHKSICAVDNAQLSLQIC